MNYRLLNIHNLFENENCKLKMIIVIINHKEYHSLKYTQDFATYQFTRCDIFILMSYMFQTVYVLCYLCTMYLLFIIKFEDVVKDGMLKSLKDNYKKDTLNSNNAISNSWNLMFMSVSLLTVK